MCLYCVTSGSSRELQSRMMCCPATYRTGWVRVKVMVAREGVCWVNAVMLASFNGASRSEGWDDDNSESNRRTGGL